MNTLWSKYRKESKQTIVIVGFLILSAKLCRADGHFSDVEKEEILKIIPHEDNQKKTLLQILDEGEKDKLSIQEDAIKIKKLIGDDHKEFLEFIIAILYRLAQIDKVISEGEMKDIQIVALEFGIVKKPFMDQIREIALKYKERLTIDRYND